MKWELVPIREGQLWEAGGEYFAYKFIFRERIITMKPYSVLDELVLARIKMRQWLDDNGFHRQSYTWFDGVSFTCIYTDSPKLATLFRLTHC